MSVRRILTLFVAGLALATASCGGSSDTKTTLSGAEMVPADVPVFISVDTDLESEQWQTAQDLLEKFPGRDRLISELKQGLADEDVDFERDVRPALGPEIAFTLLDVDDEDSFVVLVQPEDEAKLNALLDKSDEPSVHAKVGDWTAVAETQAVLDRFRSAQSGEKLSESDAYEEAVQSLPDDAILKLYAGGPQVQKAIDEGLADEGVPESFGQFGDFRSAALALTAETGGVRLEADILAGADTDFETFDPKLPETLPTGALLYVSYANLDDPARQILRAVEEAVPNFDEQRRQAEQAFGFSIETDLLPLLKNEGAFAIYPGRPLPTFMLAIAGDEAKAVRLMDRLGALLELGGEEGAQERQVEGVTIKELKIEGTSIFYAALDGVFIASNTQAGVLQVNGDGPKLADDELYQSAREGADAEGGTIGFVYGNLEEGLPFVFDFAEDEGEPVPPEARENIEPLKSFLLSSTKDGDRFELSGFLSIK